MESRFCAAGREYLCTCFLKYSEGSTSGSARPSVVDAVPNDPVGSGGWCCDIKTNLLDGGKTTSLLVL